jgi:hypothetical protein
MMKPTLLILAAGMASRFGSMKQTEGFGPSGETIMDYSIYDALRAGFGKAVFVIRKDFAHSFETAILQKWSSKIECVFVYQELDSYVHMPVPESRVKPWGTAHAILCGQSVIHEPFAVINADDFYGQAAFEQAAAFLNQTCNEHTYAIIGYRLGNTLSPFGSVSRGVCDVDEAGALTSINERTKLFRKDGAIVYEENEQFFPLADDRSVSMNFWCFHPSYFQRATELFQQFLETHGTELKSEFFIPIVADSFIAEAANKIMVIPTDATWFGVTYKEDAPAVIESLKRMTDNKQYPESLWS